MKRVESAVRFGAAALFFTTRIASADETPSLALDPAPAGERTALTEAAQVRGDAHLRARLLLDFAREPLVLENDEQEYDRVVESQFFLHALASFSFRHRLLIALDAPFVLSTEQGERAPSGRTASSPESGFSLGDLRIGARAKLLGPAGDGMHLGLAASVWLPSGQDYAGDGSARFGASVVADGVHRRFYWAANAGARTRPGERLPGIVPTRVGTEAVTSATAGFLFDSSRTWLVASEVVASFTIGEGAKLFDARGTRVHLLEEVRWTPIRDVELGAGVGPDIGQAPGAADFRAIAFVGWSPEQPPPPPDRDDDRVPDRSDACPEIPGAPASDPILNGCPEPPRDADHDEIPDSVDACPNEPGEPTGRRGTHGCLRPTKEERP